MRTAFTIKLIFLVLLMSCAALTALEVIPASAQSPCPLILTLDIIGNTNIASMTREGVLCEACVATDSTGNYMLELDKDTKVALADNSVPILIRFRKSSAALAAPPNAIILGPAYDISAYANPDAIVSSPVTISPPATLTLTYDPKELPENAIEAFIANYDASQGWQALVPVAGTVAELGKVRGLASRLSPVAVLVKLAEPTPSKFEVSNLIVKPSQAQSNQEVSISTDVANTGGQSGNYSLELKIDSLVKSSKQVVVAAGESQTVTFTANGYTAGRHQVEVAGLTGEFEIINVIQTNNIRWWYIGVAAGLILILVVLLIAARR